MGLNKSIKTEWSDGNNATIKFEYPPEDSDEELPTAPPTRTIVCTESEFEFEGDNILRSEIEFEETKFIFENDGIDERNGAESRHR